MPLLEKQWVRKVWEEGNRSAFEKIFRMYYNQLLGFAYTFMQCREQAEDIVQTVFLRIWSNKKTWNPPGPGNVKSYLFTAIRNEALNTQPMMEVLKGIALSIDLKLYRDGQTVTFQLAEDIQAES